jgi:hypothetical protein
MKTIWNAAASLALPLVLTVERKADTATPTIERAEVSHVDVVAWEKPHVESTALMEFSIAEEPKRLTLREEKRLHQLAVKDALGTIGVDEKEEFESFQKRRMKTQEPLPTVAIEKRERILRMMDNLLIELNALKREPRKGRA